MSLIFACIVDIRGVFVGRYLECSVRLHSLSQLISCCSYPNFSNTLFYLHCNLCRKYNHAFLFRYRPVVYLRLTYSRHVLTNLNLNTRLESEWCVSFYKYRAILCMKNKKSLTKNIIISDLSLLRFVAILIVFLQLLLGSLIQPALQGSIKHAHIWLGRSKVVLFII